MPENITKIIVVGVIENDRGEILVGQRLDPHFPGAHLKWEFPGGTNEFGESLEQTLKREIREETNLDIDIVTMIPFSLQKTWQHDGDGHLQHTLVFAYRCRYVSGEPRSADPKIQNLRWIRRGTFNQYDFMDTVHHLLPLIDQSSTV